jgi:CTP synthase
VKELRESAYSRICFSVTANFLDMKAKIASSATCMRDVIPVVDAEHIYAVPLALQGRACEQVVEKLNIWTKAPDLGHWQKWWRS